MIQNTKIKIILLFMMSLTLNACVGGKKPITAQSAPHVLTTFSQVVKQLPKGNAAAALPSGISGIGVSASSVKSLAIGISCVSESPTTPVDGDSDGISLLKEYSFDCTDFQSNSSSFNYQGNMKMQDLDDAVEGLKGGYLFEFNIPTFYAKNLADELTVGGSYEGKWTGSGTDTTSRFISDFKGRSYAELNLPKLGKTNLDYTYSYKWDVEFTHDAVAKNANWSSGTMNGSGSFSLSGHFISENHHGGSNDYEVQDGDAETTWKAVNVTYDQTCSKWYKSGKMVMTDTAGNTIESVFECSDVKIYFNGSLLKDVTW